MSIKWTWICNDVDMRVERGWIVICYLSRCRQSRQREPSLMLFVKIAVQITVLHVCITTSYCSASARLPRRAPPSLLDQPLPRPGQPRPGIPYMPLRGLPLPRPGQAPARPIRLADHQPALIRFAQNPLDCARPYDGGIIQSFEVPETAIS